VILKVWFLNYQNQNEHLWKAELSSFPPMISLIEFPEPVTIPGIKDFAYIIKIMWPEMGISLGYSGGPA
jgi:hypothetical protein